MRVAALNIYPVKSMAAVPLTRADVHGWGLAGDRCFMVVDTSGVCITQRECPELAVITAALTDRGVLLTTPSTGSIEAIPGDASVEVRIWSDTVKAETCTPDVDAFLGHALGVACRLVHLGDLGQRPLAAAFRTAGETVALADGFPALLTTEASLADLNARLPSPVRMNRFRPNIVVAGALPPWAEDHWQELRIGQVRFRVAKPCERCAITTVEQETGLRPDKSEPLRTLATFRRGDQGVLFGQNLVPIDTGEIALGDKVEVTAASQATVSA